MISLAAEDHLADTARTRIAEAIMMVTEVVEDAHILALHAEDTREALNPTAPGIDPTIAAPLSATLDPLSQRDPLTVVNHHRPRERESANLLADR